MVDVGRLGQLPPSRTVVPNDILTLSGWVDTVTRLVKVIIGKLTRNHVARIEIDFLAVC